MAYESRKDNFPGGAGLTGQSRKAIAVTPSDTADIEPSYAKCLYIGVAGHVSIEPVGGPGTVVFSNHPVGYLPVQTRRVNSTGTTATNIVALYDM